MLLITANPSKPPKPAARKAPSQEKKTMAKKQRTAAQKAATARMRAARKPHKNPSSPRKSYRKVHSNPRRVRRNPGTFAGLDRDIFKDLLSMEGALMVGAAFVAPMAADFVQETVMPSASGWTKLAIKEAVVLAGAWAIAKFLKKPKIALSFAVTGTAVAAADAVKLARGQLAGLSADEADVVASQPGLVRSLAMGGQLPALGYTQSLAEPSYQLGLADAFPNPFNV